MREQLALDIAQFTLDLVGVVDPFGVADELNALISIGRGKFLDAALSGASLVPYIGDLAKLGKLPKYLNSVRQAIELARADGKFATTLVPALRQLKAKALDKIPWDKLPAGAHTHLAQIKHEVDAYLRHADTLLHSKVALGRIQFVGLIGGRKLPTLTQQEVRNAFAKVGLREAHNSHFVSRLAHRGPEFGIHTLNQFALGMNNATKRLGGQAGTVELERFPSGCGVCTSRDRQGAGAGDRSLAVAARDTHSGTALVFPGGRVAVVVNEAKELITFLPLR